MATTMRPPISMKSCLSALACAYNWSVWSLLALLLFCQALVVVWSSITYAQHAYFGRPPTESKYIIQGYNDEPYADRVVVCVSDGYTYRPMQLSEAVQQSPDASGLFSNGVDGYRVVVRESNVLGDFGFESFLKYSQICDTLAMTMDAVFDACDALGYNVSRDVLRVVHGLGTDRVTVLPKALPFILIPFWDRAASGRFVVPGKDGSACVFRGTGLFQDETSSFAFMTATTRMARESKTIEWLGYPGGVWRNGWYEDPVTRTAWHMDVLSTVRDGSERELPLVQFDLLKHPSAPIHCPEYNPTDCIWVWGNETWGTQLTNIEIYSDGFFTTIASNGSRFGLFNHESADVVTVTSTYGLEQLISNVTVALLLVRWFSALYALSGTHETIGIAALANAPSFRLLPLLVLPHLKSTLEAFWTVGCQFEGSQRALSESWFVMYPAIGETVLLFFSVLNVLAKLLRRRTSDALFGPTLLFFGLLHYCRFNLAAMTWLGFDGRVTTVVTAEEVDRAFMTDFFTSDLAFRLNGRVVSLFGVKLGVLALNFVPLVVGSRAASQAAAPTLREGGVEEALAMQFDRNGGLGLGPRCTLYNPTSNRRKLSGCDKDGRNASAPKTAQPPRCAVPLYELVRAGYVVMDASPRSITPMAMSTSSPDSVSDRAPTESTSSPLAPLLVTSIDHWLWLFLSPLKLPIRVAIFETYLVQEDGGTDLGHHNRVVRVALKPRVCYISDTRFHRLRPWRLAAAAVE